MSTLTSAHLRALGDMLATKSPEDLNKIRQRIGRNPPLSDEQIAVLNVMYSEAFPGTPIPERYGGGRSGVILGSFAALVLVYWIGGVFMRAWKSRPAQDPNVVNGRTIAGWSEFWAHYTIVKQLETYMNGDNFKNADLNVRDVIKRIRLLNICAAYSNGRQDLAGSIRTCAMIYMLATGAPSDYETLKDHAHRLHKAIYVQLEPPDMKFLNRTINSVAASISHETMARITDYSYHDALAKPPPAHVPQLKDWANRAWQRGNEELNRLHARICNLNKVDGEFHEGGVPIAEGPLWRLLADYLIGYELQIERLTSRLSRDP